MNKEKLIKGTFEYRMLELSKRWNMLAYEIFKSLKIQTLIKHYDIRVKLIEECQLDMFKGT